MYGYERKAMKLLQMVFYNVGIAFVMEVRGEGKDENRNKNYIYNFYNYSPYSQIMLEENGRNRNTNDPKW